ncbi:kinase-like protein [Auricularia subglabra TFB-10046 SS5]|nr:kinase-like protein [Auricularia subglabra TFB-10046 SS5]
MTDAPYPLAIAGPALAQTRLSAVMGAIAENQFTLGELLVAVFTPDIFAAPVSRTYAQLVRSFLCGEQPVRMADVLDCLLAHPDAQPPRARQDAQLFSLSTPYATLRPARSVLTSWAAQACANRAAAVSGGAKYKLAKDQRLQPQPPPPPSRLLPLPPVPETHTTIAGASNSNVSLSSSPSAPKGTILAVTLMTDAPSVSVSISSSQPIDRGASASVWQGLMMGDPNETVALKVFRATPSPDSPHEIVDREIRAWRRLHHPRLLRLIGTSIWDSRTVLISPYMGNGNMLQYLQLNMDINPLKLIVQVAEGLKYLHNEACVVHGDLKCQNVLITDGGDAVLADFGLSTLVDKLESDSTTGSAIRWQGTLRFSAPELLGSLTDDDRGQMRSKTIKTDIYAFGMLALQAFTGTSPWRGIPEMKVIEYILSGLIPPNPGGAARDRGLDDDLWMICLWCWQFKSIDRPPINLIYETLALHQRNDSSPVSYITIAYQNNNR